MLEPCKWLQQQGYEVTYLAPDKTGQVTVQQVADALREDTVLVSMMLVNNETGCVFPVEETARLLLEALLRGPKDPLLERPVPTSESQLNLNFCGSSRCRQ